MKNYIDLIEQTFEFPTREFNVDENHTLLFNNVPLMDIIRQYGTPLKLTYLPKIGEHIENSRLLFRNAIKKFNYKGSYTYCYCTKSSHFRFITEEVLSHGGHLETSSAFDIAIIRELHRQEKLSKNTYLVCNGYKQPLYLKYITNLINDGFNVIPILDNLKEVDYYAEHASGEAVNLGIRIATDEEPNFAFYTSRLGIRYNDVVSLYKEKIEPNPKLKLKMLHFFINTGIQDSAYYWSELSRFIYKYCELKKLCPELDSIDLGGGLPIQTSLQFNYDYQAMVDEIVESIAWICSKNNVPPPNLFTEFGSYTVGESGAIIYSIIDQKLQNDKELWYMIDGSFITQIPDSWGLNQKYIMLPVNNWDAPYQKVNLGGLTCDSQDYYNSEAHSSDLYLPIYNEESEQQYIGFFHTGAYQESLGGYGGIQHCLVPAPKHVLVDLDEQGNVVTRLFSPEQTHEAMLPILGYELKPKDETHVLGVNAASPEGDHTEIPASRRGEEGKSPKAGKEKPALVEH